MPLTISTNGILENMGSAPEAVPVGVQSAPSPLINFGAGFVFRYAGVSYSGFSASPDGWLRLGSQGIADGSGMLTATTNYPMIAPYWADMETPFFEGAVKYRMSGSPPTRKFIVQWVTSAPSFSLDTVGFQLWLHETTGIMDFVYDTIYYNGNGYAIGLGANLLGSNTFASVTTASPLLASTASYSVANGMNVQEITPGTKFTFTPDQVKPAGPKNLVFSPLEAACVTIAWTDSSTSEAYFDVFRSSDNITFNKIGSILSSTSASRGTAYSYRDTLRTPGTTYYYKITSNTILSATNDTLSGSVTMLLPMLSGVKSIPGDYSSITSALDDIRCKRLAGHLVLELQQNYNSSAETFPLIFRWELFTDSLHTVTIRPAIGVSGAVISSANGIATVDINSGDYVIFDGRPGGVGSTRELEITNTNKTSCAIRFMNDACHNLVKYCKVAGNDTMVTSGVVVFAGTSGTSGNDGNKVDSCELKSAGAAILPCNIIYAKGTPGKDNNNNIISNNYITEFRGPNFFYPGNGIFISKGNTSWKIQGNHFYQTATTPTLTLSAVHTAIRINNTGGNNFDVSGNFIGGKAPNAGGASFTINGSGALKFIQLNVGKQIPSNVYNNTISNIKFNLNAPEFHRFISVDSGIVHIGTLGGNVIGSQNTTGNIESISDWSGVFLGITKGNSLDYVEIVDNKIGGISITGSLNTSVEFYGIYVAPPDSALIKGNIIGSTTTHNSINSSQMGQVDGIRAECQQGTCYIQNNTIMHITKTNALNQANNNIFGITIYEGIVPSAAFDYNISGNLIAYLRSSSPCVNQNRVAAGMFIKGYIKSKSIISGNTVHSISNSANANNLIVYGIYVEDYNTNLPLTVEKNFIHTITLASNYGGSEVCGLSVQNANTICSNNMIQLGFDSLGNSFKGSCFHSGFNTGGTGNKQIYFNSVFIGGDSVPSSASSTAYNSMFQISSTTVTVRNNIFVNTRSALVASSPRHWCIIKSGSGPFSSDNNLFYHTGNGGAFGGAGSTGYNTFAAWKTGTGYDLSSIFADPKFVNPSGGALTADLHVQSGSPIEAAGAAILSITTDYDNEVRASYTPVDIGADAGNFGFVGVNNIENTESIVFPNPFSNSADIIVSKPLMKGQLYIYDERGTQVQRVVNIKTNRIRIEEGVLSTGLYYYQIVDGDRMIASGKIIVM